MTCGECGAENKAGRRFCRACGKPLETPCPDCGYLNGAADDYCGQCGKALRAGPRAVATEVSPPHRDPHERRFVAVLFADIVGSTKFAEQRDPEVVRAVLTAYFDRARHLITRSGGTVEKFIGDAVMAVWGATVAREDDAERAVRAGLEMTDMVARLGEEMVGEELAVRVGVLTGEASVSPATPEQGFIVGDLVNTASRLQTLAEPGTVVVGDSTRRLLRDSVEFEAMGEHTLRGRETPVALYRVVRVKTGRPRRVAAGGWESPFVGRGDVLRLLKDAFHATERTGRSRLVSIVGEAGIGKTRLADEFEGYLGGLAGDVYWHDGRSPAYDQGVSLWALGEMVRQRAGIAETDDALRSRTKLRTTVAELVPAGDHEWVEVRLAALLGLDTNPTGERAEFFSAIRSFFHAMAERHPTLLVFEDFHWADEGLIEFVTELVDRSPRHPILVLTLARPDLLDRVPGWGAGRRNFASAQLGPLTRDEMDELISGMVRGIGGDLVASIGERASGIPLYAVELVRMLIADGALKREQEACCSPTRDLSKTPIPETIRAVVEARLDRLPVEARRLLQDAAVLGAAFTKRGLAAMSGLSNRRLDELVDSLVHRELLEYESDPRSPERGQYRFVQSIIRDVAYGRLTREERRVRHTRAAEFFAGLGEVELAGAVASHLMSARNVTPGEHDAAVLAEEAVAALAEAADHATRMHSHSQGLAMLEQAIAATTDPRVEADLLQRAARSASSLAKHEKAMSYAERALRWFHDNGDSEEVVGAAALVANLACSAFKPVEAIAVVEPILGSEPALGNRAAVRAGATLARAYLMALRDADAGVMADRVIESAERLELIPATIDAMITRGTALGNLGRMHEAIALLQGAIRYADENDLPFAHLRAANNVGHLLTFDDHIGAMEVCRQGMELADRLGEVGFLTEFAWARSAYLDRDGRYGEAQEIRKDVRDRFELPPASSLWYELSDLVAQAEQGDAGASQVACELLRNSMDHDNPQMRASIPVVKAGLDMLGGRFEDAYRAVMGVDDWQRSPENLVRAAFAAALLGDGTRLERVAAEAESNRGRGRLLGAIGSIAEGALSSLGGDTAGAIGHFTQALSFRYLGLDRAKVQGLFATLVGRKEPEARRASDAAYEAFAATGAVAYLDLFSDGMPPAEEGKAAGS